MNISIFIEATIVGMITFIIGSIVFNLTINKKNKINKSESPIGINLSFFATGFIIHMIIQLVGFNQYICDKQCQKELVNKLGL
jgi:hypothetical protein